MYSNDLNLWVLLESEFWTSILSVQRDYACCALPNIFWSLNQIFAGNRVFESTFSSITDFVISWKHQISQLWRQSWTKLLCWSIQYSWSHVLANGQYNKMDTKNIILSAEIRISSFGQSSRINTMSFDHSIRISVRVNTEGQNLWACWMYYMWSMLTNTLFILRLHSPNQRSVSEQSAKTALLRIELPILECIWRLFKTFVLLEMI